MRIFQPDRLLSVDLLKRRYATVRKKDPAARGTDADDFLLDERELTEHDALRAELRSFVTAVATGSPPVVSGEDGRAALAIGNPSVESLQRHAELGRERIRAAEAACRRATPAAAADPPLRVR
jgi:predicted dehydrogenase